MGYSCDCQTTWLTAWTANVTEIKPSDDCLGEIAEKIFLAEQELRNRDFIKYDQQRTSIRQSFLRITPTGSSWQWRYVDVVRNCFNNNFIQHKNIKFESPHQSALTEREVWYPPDYKSPRGNPYNITTFCRVNGQWVRSDGCANTNDGSPGAAEEIGERQLIRFDLDAYSLQIFLFGNLTWEECTPGDPKCVGAPNFPSNLNCVQREEFIDAGTVNCIFESFTSEARFRASWSNQHTC